MFVIVSFHFYRAALNAVRSSREKGVCLSVKRVDRDKTAKSVQVFTPYERSFSLVFWEKEWLLGSDLKFCTWNFGSKWPHWSEIADFQSIFARSSSAVTPSEKVQSTLLGSPLRAFQWAVNMNKAIMSQRNQALLSVIMMFECAP